VTGISIEDLQDTINSAHKKAKGQGLEGKRAMVGFMCKGGIFLGGVPQKVQDTDY
jgi:hypothetical protein